MFLKVSTLVPFISLLIPVLSTHLFIYLFILLRYNSHNIKLAILKWIIQWYLVHLHYIYLYLILRHFHHPKINSTLQSSKGAWNKLV